MHSVTDGYAKEQRLVLPCDAAKAENICVANSSRFDDLTSAPTLLKYYNVRATNSHHFAGSICQREHCVPPNPVEAPPPEFRKVPQCKRGQGLHCIPDTHRSAARKDACTLLKVWNHNWQVASPRAANEQQ